MAWSDSGPDRRRKLPSDWQQLRQECFERDGWQCTYRNAKGRCREVPTDCDHVGDRDDHDLANLTSKCSRHHREKTASQGGQASAWARIERRKRFSRHEPHPGLNW